MNGLNLSKLGLVLALPLLLVIAACNGVVDDNNEFHPDIGMLEVIDRGDGQRPVVATWTDDDEWDVEELMLDTPLREGGDRASLGVRVYDHDMNELELDEDGEFFVTYVLAQDAPEGVIDTTLDDDVLYHGDHVHVYPLSEGETQIEFVLWHIDHAEDWTTPLTIQVLEPETE